MTAEESSEKLPTDAFPVILPDHEQALVVLAAKYHKLLTSIDLSDKLLVSGLREGLNKFLSNTFLELLRGSHKYRRTHFVSPAALQRLNDNDYTDLAYEHLVPKDEHIQRPCIEAAKARDGTFTVEFVLDLLRRYWVIAVITKDEDQKLKRTMPVDWDRKDVFARYRHCDIKLVENPYFPLGGLSEGGHLGLTTHPTNGIINE